jgi:hypothetical protein
MTLTVLAALLLAAAPVKHTKPAAKPRPPAASPAAAAAAAPAPDASPSARPVHHGTGAVTYVTAARAYLDAGAADGLAVGAELALRRDGAPAGRCTVEAVAPHHAVCTGARARPGDIFPLAAAGDPPPPKLLPPPPTDEVLANRRAVVEGTPVPPVVFQAGPAAPEVLARPRAIDVSITHQSWNVSPGGASSKESLDLLARGVPLTGWLFLDLDARLEHWTARQNPRFRPNDKTQVYIWQAQLTAIPSERLTLSAGRVLPWGVPGATIFDGAMAGWRGRMGETATEVGFFGGTVPDPQTTQFTSTRYTGGAYWSLDRQAGGVTLRSEGRLAAVHTPELGTRGELSLTGRGFTKQADLSAEVDLGAGGKQHAPSYVDAARLDVTLRPTDGLRLGGSFRYSGLEWPQTFEPPAFPGRIREGDAFATYDVVHWLRLGAVGGVSEDADSKVSRKWIGPEVTFPQVLWSKATVTAAYLEERGFMGGRSAYAQIVAAPLPRLWVLGRVAWSHEQTDGPIADEGSITLGAHAELTKWLAARTTLSLRAPLSEGSGDHSLTGFVTLTGGF